MYKESKGFTLIEMIIVISIFVIISTIMLADFPGFSQRVALERTAQEIALSFREAETEALSVGEAAFGTGIFPGFGVHFSISSPREYILFADLNNNNVYDGVSEEVDHFFIEKSPQIVGLCVDVETSPPGNCSITRVDIVYLRPDPTITITTDAGEYSNTTIIIETPRGDQKSIISWFTGQIEIR